MSRISLLVSRDFAVLVQAAMSLPKEVAKQMRAQMRRVAEPGFFEELLERADTRLQHRVIVDTARVSVRDDNVILRTAATGKVGKGVSADVLKSGAEFGMRPDRPISSRSRKGTRYERKVGAVFKSRRPRGWVFFPAVQAFIPRAGALWFQTVYRTVAETFEKASK